MSTLLDRRKNDRFIFPISVKTQQQLTAPEIINFSGTGLKLCSPTELVLGTSLPITIAANDETFDIEARVVWKKIDIHLEKPNFFYGLLLQERKDINHFRHFLSESPKKFIQDRRAKVNIHKSKLERRGRDLINHRLQQKSQALDEWYASHTYERVVASGAGPELLVRDQLKINLSSNSYLGLTEHPAVREAAIKAIEKYGAGIGGVRYLSGTTELHKQLEEKLAEFKGAEACLIFSSGYMANFAALNTVLESGDIVFNDFLNHASIIDGCRNTKASVRFYHHNDMSSLKKRLQKYPIEQPKLIITDGVFSMDGDVAPLDQIIALGRQYGAMVMVDDAHAIGVLGEKGHGTAEHCGVFGEADITTVTLSKTLGMVGGAICGSRALIKNIFQGSRQFIFTSTLPPVVCASALAGLKVIETEPELVTYLHDNRNYLCLALQDLGFDAINTPSALIPVLIGPREQAWALANMLEEMGVFVNAITDPAVDKDKARLRVSVMASHTREHLEKAVHCFAKAGKKLGLI